MKSMGLITNAIVLSEGFKDIEVVVSRKIKKALAAKNAKGANYLEIKGEEKIHIPFAHFASFAANAFCYSQLPRSSCADPYLCTGEPPARRSH
jgi:hypothetical protein